MLGRTISLIALGMAVNLFNAVSPSLLGAMVDYQGLSVDVAGRLTVSNLWGAGAASVAAIFLLHRPRWNLRATMFVCLLLVIITNVASVWFAGEVGALAVVRFLNGVGAGMGFTVSCVAAVGTPRVERIYAILYGSPFLIGGVGMAILPDVYHHWGIAGAFYGMGAINLLVMVLLPLFPRTIAETPTVAGSVTTRLERPTRRLVAVALLALMLHYAFNSGIWPYFERLGVASGMSADRVGVILGPAIAAAILGMIAASLLGARLGYAKPIFGGITAIIAATMLLLYSSSEVAFGVGVAVFNASITFTTPYMIAILALLVPSGRGVSSANVATIMGFSLGPFAISFLVAGGQFTTAIVVTAVGFTVVLALYAAFLLMLDRRTGGLEELKALCLGTRSTGTTQPNHSDRSEVAEDAPVRL